MAPKKTASKPTPKLIADSFVAAYYTMFENERHKLHNFYHASSQFLHSYVGVESESVTGKEEIKAVIAKDPVFSKDAVVTVKRDTVDVQAVSEGEIVLLVTGSVSVSEGAETAVMPFVQNFFLEQSSTTTRNASYYVLNDTFRLLGNPKDKVTAKPAKAAVKAAVKVKAPVVEKEAKAATPPPAKPIEVKPAEIKQPVEVKPAESKQPVEVKPAEPKPVEVPKGPMSWAQRAANTSKPAAAPAPTPAPAAEEPKPKPTKADSRGETIATSLYVKGLPDGTTEEAVKTLFSTFGEVKTVTMKDERKFCFVDFAASECATSALAAPEKCMLEEKLLSIEPRLNKTPGGGKGKGRGKGKGGKGDGGKGPRSEGKGKGKGERRNGAPNA
eukprot:CAMPEP_0172588966 /NCGR_PEP_ID=MMETSP1068-20121228/7786_1 /TAXON_ID=35684 /ORGANISM="Pseudopedinella elastica, Strain CCMP716" /LENGTH=384 /DNA_ID=CAMNT_0013384443 /DNA_START=88 /DNA_END=1242 /DNA_ORIENTATION=-